MHRVLVRFPGPERLGKRKSSLSKELQRKTESGDLGDGILAQDFDVDPTGLSPFPFL